MKCNCAEVKGYPIVPRFHNCEYVRRRNQLVEIADRWANSVSTQLITQNSMLPDEAAATYNKCFTFEMEKLVKEWRI